VSLQLGDLSVNVCVLDYVTTPKLLLFTPKESVGCSKSMATRPTLASQVKPKVCKVLHLEDAERREIVPDLAPQASFQVFVLMVQEQQLVVDA
jgi:hypothetical protein